VSELFLEREETRYTMKHAEYSNGSSSSGHECTEETERSRKIIQAIFDSTKSVILLVSPDYHIIFFNKKALHTSKLLYGVDLKVGDSFMDYQRKGDEAMFLAFEKNFNKAMVTNEIVISEREMQFNDINYWFRSEYTPVHDQGQIIGVALRVIDITERKKRDQHIQNQDEQLRKISWIQSHQTRQPIATILGLINVMDKTSLTEDNLQIIKMLEGEIDKLDTVVREIVIRANSVS
jgi:nitrogen-specific signal transduction histidine kinase